MVSDCEELVGVTHRGWWDWFRRTQHISLFGGLYNLKKKILTSMVSF